MKYLWPIHTGITFFDFWSVVHFAFWVVVGSLFWARHTRRLTAVLGSLTLAYAWEAAERYLERAYPAYWLSPESWVNSCLSDPAMCLAGLFFVWYGLDHWRKA